MSGIFVHNLRDGILLVAHSNAAYASESIALAWSIRKNSPGIPIVLATDVANLDIADGLFDHVIRYDFTAKGGVSFKLWLDEITPYQRNTLFIDSDAFVFRDVSFLFDVLKGMPFAALGRTQSKVGHWFADCAAVMARFGMKQIPFFIGDFYWFDRSPQAAEVFRRGRKILADYDAIGINRLHGGFNDEPVFALAMHQAGVAVQPREPDQIIALESPHLSALRTNALRGIADCICAGVPAKPAIVHYGSFRSQAIYFRERLRIERDMAGKPPYGDWRSELAGRVESFKFRALRRMRRIF